MRSFILDLGADEFVDLEQDAWSTGVEQSDVVFDTIGGDILAQSVSIVRSGGALVSVASPPPAERGDIRSIYFIRDPNGAQLIEIARLVDSGQLRPHVGAVYPLAQAREAFTAKAAGGIPGPGHPPAVTFALQ